MNELSIYCLYKSELVECESISKGYRADIYVKIKNNYYNLMVYDIVRLQQDFEAEIEYYGFYTTYPNLFLVKEVSMTMIIYTIKKHFKQGYFEALKPISEDDSVIEKLLPIL